MVEAKFAEIPDELWEQVEPLLPAGPRRGRPPIPNRTILSGIVYRLRTGSQWKALPAQFGSGSVSREIPSVVGGGHLQTTLREARPVLRQRTWRRLAIPDRKRPHETEAALPQN